MCDDDTEDYRDAHRRRLAHHEAGHAVIGRVLGLVCGYVTIVADTESAGHSITEDPYVTDRAWVERGRYRDMDTIVHGRIMALMAGREAEDECLGVCPSGADYGDGEDRYQIACMLDFICDQQTDVAACEARLRARTLGLVRRHRPSIERMAAELLQHETLTAEEADALVPRALTPFERKAAEQARRDRDFREGNATPIFQISIERDRDMEDTAVQLMTAAAVVLAERFPEQWSEAMAVIADKIARCAPGNRRESVALFFPVVEAGEFRAPVAGGAEAFGRR